MERIDTPETFEIAAVPTPDIARWVAKVNLINYALEQNRSVMVGGMADDGIMYDYMVREAKQGADWRNLPVFESAILYEMKSKRLGYKTVVNGPTAYANDPRYAEGKNISMDITRTALKVGLGRVGLYGADEPHVPTDALAALHYMKGNIKDPVDRKLYERADEIDEAVIAIESMIRTRSMTIPVLRPTETGMVPEDLEVSVYFNARKNMDADKARELGLDPESPLDPWWQELQNDLARIDEASNQQRSE